MGDCMKKFFLILLLVLCFLCTGCEKEKEKVVEVEKKEEATQEEVVVPSYEDLNSTPISFYQLKGNTLTKLTSWNGNYVSMDDIGLFQIYPSNEETVTLEKGFASSFYEEWMKYNTHNPLKIGFSLSFHSGQEDIFYNILTPSNTMEHWEYIMAYLYDDYSNMGQGFYSHIEENDYTDSTLFTAIKLQCGYLCRDIPSSITFSVFTYDGEDDFLEGKYRGNSQSNLSICLKEVC